MSGLAERRERVVLDLVDNFSTPMARAAATTALLHRELDGLSGTSVTATRDSDRLGASLRRTGDDASRVGDGLRRSSADLNQFTGRLGLAVRAVAAFGPAFVPITAAAVPAVAALTAGLGAAAGAAGVALLALSGLGDAMESIDAYQLKPTTENLQEMERALHQLGPAGAQFAKYLDSIEPQLRSLQLTAREGFLPGAEEGIETLLTRLPQVRRIIFDIATGLGELAESSGKALAGNKFRAFFDYLETDARPTLVAFAQSTGNVVEGVANMLVAFAPMNRAFTGGLVEMTQAFADWSAGLGENAGFQEFLSYIRETGPQVLTLIGQIAVSLAAVVEAAAPVGQVLLPALTALAKVIETIADSDLGTPLLAGVAAMSALRLATQAWSKVAATSVGTFVAGQSRAAGSILTVVSAQQRAVMSANQLAAAQRAQTQGAIAGAGRLGLVLGGLALASSGAGESIGLTNTASMALMGSFAGPVGAALGAGVGTILDVKASANDASEALRNFDDAMQSGDPAAFAAALEQVNVQLERQTSNSVLGTDFLGDFAGGLVNTIAPASNLDKIVGQLTGSTDDLREAAEEQAPAAEAAAAAMERKAKADGVSARVARIARTETRELNAAMEEQVSAASAAFDAVTRYAEALAAARKRAKESNAGLDENTKAGRENREVLAGLRDAWNAQGKAVANNVDKWREARGNFIQVARDMGASAEQARNLADRLLEIPKQRQIDIKMYGSEEAADRLERIRKAVTSIPREWSTTYYVNQVNAINKGGYEPDPDKRAGGGPIYGPGTKTSDSVPILASTGEFMMSAAAVDHYGLDAMFAMNARRLASGGDVAGRAPGLTPKSQLFGIDQAFLSVRELAERLSNLSAVQIRGLQRDFSNLGKFEVVKLGKALDVATKAIEKQAQKAREFSDEQVEQLKALKDARRDFARQVTGNFRSDIFGGNIDLTDAAMNGMLGADFDAQLQAYIAANMGAGGSNNQADWIQQYLGTLGSSQIAALQAQASIGTLQQDQRSAGAFEYVLEQLRSMGLTGGAFAELAASGNYAQANAYLQMGPDFIKTLMTEFRDRNQSLQGLGQSVGNAQFGADIREQRRAMEKAVRIAERQESELREANRINRLLERHLERIENHSPKKTGEAVAAAVNGAVSHGRRNA